MQAGGGRSERRFTVRGRGTVTCSRRVQDPHALSSHQRLPPADLHVVHSRLISVPLHTPLVITPAAHPLQRDLAKLRLTTARAYVRVLTDGQVGGGKREEYVPIKLGIKGSRVITAFGRLWTSGIGGSLWNLPSQSSRRLYSTLSPPPPSGCRRLHDDVIHRQPVTAASSTRPGTQVQAYHHCKALIDRAGVKTLHFYSTDSFLLYPSHALHLWPKPHPSTPFPHPNIIRSATTAPLT